jgi:hypothetical protein
VRTVFDNFNTGVVVSSLIRGMNVCPLFPVSLFVLVRLKKILTTVYVVQNSQNFSGLFPSSCIPKKHDVSETGSVSVLR